MSHRPGERPRLWIVAGPNGSGKSSLYEDPDIEGFGRSVWIINPDRLAVRVADAEHMELAPANGSALDRIRDWLDASIRAHQTVGVETVLSTPKYRTLVEHARRFHFEVRLIYVFLQTGELNLERVRARVAKGGHAVPEAKILERRERSFQQLPWFLAAADRAWLYDNSGAEPVLIGQKADDTIVVQPTIPEIERAVNEVSRLQDQG